MIVEQRVARGRRVDDVGNAADGRRRERAGKRDGFRRQVKRFRVRVFSGQFSEGEAGFVFFVSGFAWGGGMGPMGRIGLIGVKM